MKNRILIYQLIIMVFILILSGSCRKDVDYTYNPPPKGQVPVLTTIAVSYITQTTARCGGNITFDSASTVTERGVCWSTEQTPTIADSRTNNGIGNGSFTSNVSYLIPNTKYFVRAFATNNAGTAYGNTISFTTISTYAIGQSYQGGIIVYNLLPGDIGYDANVPHGLIAAPYDQGNGIKWYNGSFISTNATSEGIGTGNANTNTIVNCQGTGSYAAKLCFNLVLGGYGDWYLPSKNEFLKLYLNKAAIGNLSPIGCYWSSTENNGNTAVKFSGNGSMSIGNKSDKCFVRAVRSF